MLGRKLVLSEARLALLRDLHAAGAALGHMLKSWEGSVLQVESCLSHKYRHLSLQSTKGPIKAISIHGTVSSNLPQGAVHSLAGWYFSTEYTSMCLICAAAFRPASARHSRRLNDCEQKDSTLFEWSSQSAFPSEGNCGQSSGSYFGGLFGADR